MACPFLIGADLSDMASPEGVVHLRPAAGAGIRLLRHCAGASGQRQCASQARPGMNFHICSSRFRPRDRTCAHRAGSAAAAGSPRHGNVIKRQHEEQAIMTGAGTDSTRPAREGGPAIVLVQPQLAVNIGVMRARAMAQFGLNDLRLVSPREGWPRAPAYRKGAYATAAGAVYLLEQAKQIFDRRGGGGRSQLRLCGHRARAWQVSRCAAAARGDGGQRREDAAGEKHGDIVRTGAYRPRQ